MLLPPIPVTIKAPVLSPLQATFKILLIVQTGTLRFVISAAQVLLQPFISVTVTMKLPGPKSLITFPLTVPAPASKAYTAVPPVALTVMVPSLAPQSDS